MKAKVWSVEERNSEGGVMIHDLKFTLREAVIAAAKHPKYVVFGPFELDIPTALDSPNPEEAA